MRLLNLVVSSSSAILGLRTVGQGERAHCALEIELSA